MFKQIELIVRQQELMSGYLKTIVNMPSGDSSRGLLALGGGENFYVDLGNEKVYSLLDSKKLVPITTKHLLRAIEIYDPLHKILRAHLIEKLSGANQLGERMDPINYVMLVAEVMDALSNSKEWESVFDLIPGVSVVKRALRDLVDTPSDNMTVINFDPDDVIQFVNKFTYFGFESKLTGASLCYSPTDGYSLKSNRDDQPMSTLKFAQDIIQLVYAVSLKASDLEPTYEDIVGQLLRCVEDALLLDVNTLDHVYFENGRNRHAFVMNGRVTVEGFKSQDGSKWLLFVHENDVLAHSTVIKHEQIREKLVAYKSATDLKLEEKIRTSMSKFYNNW